MPLSDTTQPPEDFCSLAVLRRRYDDYLAAKRDERAEAETARRYYHGDQWTAHELKVLEERKLSQADAAKVLRVTQPKISALRHYKLAGFSVERLMNLLTAVDQDVEIVIRRKPRSRKTGRISVVAA